MLSGAATAIAPSVMDAVHAVDANVSPYEVVTMGALVTRAAVPQRIAASLVAILSVVALGLSALGLYGVISYSVSQGPASLGSGWRSARRRRSSSRTSRRAGSG